METTTSKTTASRYVRELKCLLYPTSDLRSSALLLDTLEAELEEYETQLLELNTYSNELTHKYNEKVEFQECLEKGRKFLAAEADGASSKLDTVNPLSSAYGAPAISEDGMQPLLADATRGHSGASSVVHKTLVPSCSGLASGGFKHVIEGEMKFSSTVGILKADEKSRFERMLFRSTRGNCFARFAEVERPIADAATGRPEFKIVFIVFFKSEVISAIINKICDAFGARQYPVPDHLTLGNASQLGLIVRETTSELADVALLRHVIFCAS